MSIEEMILFVSTTSPACRQPLEFISRFGKGLPIRVVRLDTVEQRQAAATGRHFQVVSVPTMVMIYEDGNLQMFVGSPKISTLLSGFVEQIARAKGRTEQAAREREHSSQIDTAEFERQTSPPTEVDYVVEDDSSSDEAPPPPPPKPKKKPPQPKTEKKEKKKGPNRRKKHQEVIDDDVEEMEILVDTEPRAPPKATGSTRMQNIYDMARQMERDRTDSLGYDETKLPHF